MARNFVDTSNHILRSAGGVTLPSSYPFSTCVWAKNDNATVGDQCMLNLLEDGAGGGERIQLSLIDDAGTQGLVAFYDAGASASGVTLDIEADYAADTFFCATYIVTSSEQRVYFNGSANTASQAHSLTLPPLDRVDVAHISLFGGVTYWDGDIAEIAIFDKELSDDEIDLLAAGFSARHLPQSLHNNWPLLGNNSPETDIVGDIDLVVTGATKAEHPRIVLPHKRRFFSVPAAALVPVDVDVSNAQVITLSPQGPTIRVGASVLSDVQVLTLQPQGPTIDAAVTTDVDVSDPVSILLSALDPTIQAGASVRVADATDLIVQPQGPSVQGGAGTFVDVESLIIQPQGPNIETGASAIVEDPQGILLQPQGPLVSTGALISVSEAGVIRITAPGPTIVASTAIGAEVEAPVCLTLSPIGPNVVAGAQAQRYSVHIGKGTTFSKGVRDHAYDVGDKGVSRDSEDFE